MQEYGQKSLVQSQDLYDGKININKAKFLLYLWKQTAHHWLSHLTRAPIWITLGVDCMGKWIPSATAYLSDCTNQLVSFKDNFAATPLTRCTGWGWGSFFRCKFLFRKVFYRTGFCLFLKSLLLLLLFCLLEYHKVHHSLNKTGYDVSPLISEGVILRLRFRGLFMRGSIFTIFC